MPAQLRPNVAAEGSRATNPSSSCALVFECDDRFMATKSQFPNEQSEDGSFVRQDDEFRDWLSTDPASTHPVQANRYHLYVSLACPWACRTVIVRKLKGLEGAIGLTVLDPIRDKKGWAFREGHGYTTDPINGFAYLSEAYLATDPNFKGRVTVPVLWDKVAGKMVNNSENDICRMLNGDFAALGKGGPDLFPSNLEPEHGMLSEWIYDKINNGVYKAGFANTQATYEVPCRELFAALDEIEDRLSTRRYLFGDQSVEADWRLFCTLVRFDAVYFGHFKCNLRRISDYKNLQGYLQDLYQQHGIADTVNMDHIKRHYYFTHDDINPTQVVPIGPVLNLDDKHNRRAL